MEDELRGWKAIADSLGTSPRTAQRWERDLHLPVHRAGGERGTTVVATRRELQEWRLSSVGQRAETETEESAEDGLSASGSVSGAPAPPGEASAAVEPPPESDATDSRLPDGWRPSRRILVVGAACIVLAGVVWVTLQLRRPSIDVSDRSSSASSDVQGYTKPISSAVVVLKLIGANEGSWSVRVVEGAMATYAIGGQPKLGLSVAFQTPAQARLSLSEIQPTPNGSERLTLLNVVPLTLRVPAVVTHAGRQIAIEWVGTEKTSPNASTAGNGAPPRCCLSCGGVVLCAMKVEAWCGSCCDPRSAACPPLR